MKQKQKRKHLESPYSPPTAKKSRANLNLQEDLQCKHKAVTSASAQAARRASSSSSEYLSCISSEDRLSVAGISKLCTCDPTPGCSLEDSPLVSEARSGSSESEYFTCYSSLYHLSSAEVLNTDEDIPPPGPSGLAQGHGQTAEDSDSDCVSSADKLIHSGKNAPCQHPCLFWKKLLKDLNGKMKNLRKMQKYVSRRVWLKFWKSQEDVPQPESSVVVPPRSETAGENSSASEYFTCVSSISKLIPAKEGGVPQTHQDVSCVGHSEEYGTSSPFPHTSFPFHLVHDPTPSVSSVHTEEEELMKVYYMHVQMKRGVAVLCDPEEGLEPPSKKTKIEEMTFPEKIQEEVIPSHVCTKEFLTDSESSWNNEAQEEKEEADCPAEPPTVEECSRAKTPEWLVALDSGFRCMACCRVFPSLEDLQEHVQHGVSEGFSCHTFHMALTWLKNKNRREKEKSRQTKNTKKTTYRCQKKKHFGMKLSSYK
uniref:protein FAM170A-like isoform X1 n=1 Tax=Halichoerus grypus TaxID=9711 RepID=UPI001659857F|nr:protein FAM170A-like isoform X1 [Halichoerus grypus]XP_035945807.1 protein FAM170A-like isoform X1 [Halichoerus grypus]XP_035945808.1 protein FAM170A-like isoform X1 [Halichoerus grypus]